MSTSQSLFHDTLRWLHKSPVQTNRGHDSVVLAFFAATVRYCKSRGQNAYRQREHCLIGSSPDCGHGSSSSTRSHAGFVEGWGCRMVFLVTDVSVSGLMAGSFCGRTGTSKFYGCSTGAWLLTDSNLNDGPLFCKQSGVERKNLHAFIFFGNVILQFSKGERLLHVCVLVAMRINRFVNLELCESSFHFFSCDRQAGAGFVSHVYCGFLSEGNMEFKGLHDCLIAEEQSTDRRQQEA